MKNLAEKELKEILRCPIKEMSLSEKLELPVSWIVGPDGNIYIVSAYRDLKWKLGVFVPNPTVAKNGLTIDWQARLLDGSMLTENEYLLESSMDFIWNLLHGRPSKHIKPSTVYQKHNHLLNTLDFMALNGIQSFKSLQKHTLEYVVFAQVPRPGSVKEESEVSEGTMSNRLVILQDLYYYRHGLRDALLSHPWPGQTAHKLSKRAISGKVKTPLIPEPVFKVLASVALDYVENRADSIIKAHLLLKAHKRNTAKIRSALNNFGFADGNEVRNSISYLRTACYIVIGIFTGIRESELLSLELSCTYWEKGAGVISDLLWIRGIRYKSEITPKRKSWIAPPVVEKAVEILERLSNTFREEMEKQISEIEAQIEACKDTSGKTELLRVLNQLKAGRRRLFIGKHNCNNQVRPICDAAAGQALHSFCQAHRILGPDNKPYMLSEHQMRRTFAWWVVRAGLDQITALKNQFMHVNSNLSAMYSHGASEEIEIDSDLLAEILDAKQQADIEIMSDVLAGDYPIGNKQAWDWALPLRAETRAIPTEEKRQEFIRDMASFFVLQGTGHGLCVGREPDVASSDSGCKGRCVLLIEMCTTCQCGLTTPQYLDEWRDRKRENELLANDTLLTAFARENARKLLRQDEKMIAILEGRDPEWVEACNQYNLPIRCE